MTNKERFESIFNEKIIPVRAGADRLLAWMQESDFFTAPASTRFHGAYEGGLCDHSLAVHDNLLKLNETYGFGFSEDSMALVALGHDVCKANFYKPSTRNVKNEETGRWEKVPCYTIEDQLPYGHGEKSALLILRCGVVLSDAEVMAVRWHMGAFDDSVKGGCRSIGDAYEKYPLAWALHVADEAATWVDKC